MDAIHSIEVNVHEQRLLALDRQNQLVKGYRVATAKNGVGQENGSECTPLGSHRIRAKIGDGAAPNSVFVGRRLTGEIYSESLAQNSPDRDWILTRIMWLCGNQSGFNRGGQVDTMRRYIYIHGAPDSHPMGVPSSHGCIKMRNSDIIQIFDQIAVGTPVAIVSK